MAALTTQTLVNAGTPPTFAPAEVTDYVEVGNGQDTFAVYKNTNVATRTITVEMDHSTLETGVVYPSKVYTIAADTGETWIPLRKIYIDTAEAGIGRAVLNVSDSATDVTVAVVRVGA
jgi:hypothetical protein